VAKERRNPLRLESLWIDREHDGPTGMWPAPGSEYSPRNAESWRLVADSPGSVEIIATISISPWRRGSKTPATTYDTFPGKMPEYRIDISMQAPTLPAPAPIAEKFGTITAPPRVPHAAVRRRVGWYLRLHLLCLILYSFFGKGFAYLGTGSFYVSEVLLVLGLIALIASRKLLLLCRTSIGCVMLPFFLWQCACAIPYVSDYGVDVARDAMVWGYAAFAWIVAALIAPSPPLLERLLERYRRFVPWFLVFGPSAALVTMFFAARMPTWPGTEVPFISLKLDEYTSHLAGIAASVITGLNPATWWLTPVALAVLIGVSGRGGVVGFIIAIIVAGILARRLRALVLPLAMLLVVFFAAALDIHITVPGRGREISAAQLFDDIDTTVSSDVESEDLQNTKEWRLDWWQTIWDYTVDGPYFLTGKGYGINLANDDGFQTDPVGQSLRSPHNSHITFLARSGVPGAVLWITLQFTWLGSMLVSFLRAKRSGKPRWTALFAWIISYWVAFVVTASFDVFLESPMAAIPFWTIFGLGWGSHIMFSRARAADLISLAPGRAMK
jgi:hypothetical protein